jgi:hypothetical protein
MKRGGLRRNIAKKQRIQQSRRPHDNRRLCLIASNNAAVANKEESKRHRIGGVEPAVKVAGSLSSPVSATSSVYARARLLSIAFFEPGGHGSANRQAASQRLFLFLALNYLLSDRLRAFRFLSAYENGSRRARLPRRAFYTQKSFNAFAPS